MTKKINRRKFLVSAPVVAAAAAPARLFGAPVSIKPRSEVSSRSVENQVRYRLSNLKIAPDYWEQLVKLNSLWESVCTDKSCSAKFSQNPKGFLSDYGMSENEQLNLLPEINALAVFVDQDIANAAAVDDIDSFMRVLSEKNVLKEVNHTSSLRESMEPHFINSLKVFEAGERTEDEIKSALLRLYGDLNLLSEDRDLALVPGNQVAAVAAAAIVIIAVSVLLYVTVGVTAGAGILAAVAISAVASIAVTVGVGGGGGHSFIDREKSFISEMMKAAQIADVHGNKNFSAAIANDIANVKRKVAENLDSVLNSAVAAGLVNFEGVEEEKVRASLHTLVNAQLGQIG